MNEQKRELTKEQMDLIKVVMNNTYMLWGKRIASIPIQLLNVDTSYQRVEVGNVNKLIREWDNEKCRFLVVSLRDMFNVIDGQHRLIAAKALGITELPCEIYTGLTREEEARRFLQGINHTRLSP